MSPSSGRATTAPSLARQRVVRAAAVSRFSEQLQRRADPDAGRGDRRSSKPTAACAFAARLQRGELRRRHDAVGAAPTLRLIGRERVERALAEGAVDDAVVKAEPAERVLRPPCGRPRASARNGAPCARRRAAARLRRRREAGGLRVARLALRRARARNEQAQRKNARQSAFSSTHASPARRKYIVASRHRIARAASTADDRSSARRRSRRLEGKHDENASRWRSRLLSARRVRSAPSRPTSSPTRARISRATSCG